MVLKHKECLSLIRPMNLPSEKLAVLQIQNACFVGIPIIAAERARLISFPLRSLARPFVESCSLAVCVCVFVCCVASRVPCPGHFKPSVSARAPNYLISYSLGSIEEAVHGGGEVRSGDNSTRDQVIEVSGPRDNSSGLCSFRFNSIVVTPSQESLDGKTGKNHEN